MFADLSLEEQARELLSDMENFPLVGNQLWSQRILPSVS